MDNRKLKHRLISAVLVFVMLVSSLLGATFAWFTDTVTSAGNKIESGNLQIDLLHKTESDWVSVKDNPTHKIFGYDNWEPGYTGVETLKILNLGSLALQYKLSVEVADDTAVLGEHGENLADVIDVYVYYGESDAESYADITASDAWTYKGTLTEAMANPQSFIGGQLLPTGEVLDNNAAATTAVGDQIFMIALHMQESAGNEYQELSVGDIIVNLVATQWSYESDSFDATYDEGALFPNLNIGGLEIPVQTENGLTTAETTAQGTGVRATIPAGVSVSGTSLNLSVVEMQDSQSNVTLAEGEALRALDVHMAGVSANNTVPMLITIEQAMTVGLNIGNYTLYHVEGGESVAMRAVGTLDELDAHNEFYYDPTTGDVTLAMATFSEVALVAEPPKWEGKFDYTWYTNAVAPLGEEDKNSYIIANADQLAAFGAIVGGMDSQTQNSFAGKTVKLIADINLGDAESENNPDLIFYPIGYYNSEGTYERTNTAITSGLRNFEGTFDGNGHTVSNFYHNTWEMKGDHDWYSPEEQYYRDGMGLFGRVYKGTVKNLTVKNFSSDGEIATTGVIAAYADGATFENIAIFYCNPRVYNIGNGGIVGCVGWYAKEADLKTTFKNITVDNSNKISALWGSYDVACGGIVGQYYPTSGQTSAGTPKNAGMHFDNCHISAVMDVYNDVCANYQYYAYRYTGMLIGSVRENETIDGHVYPKMDGITAEGCTVHFGTWNDYYYCEIIDNTTASYTHDYQMSRLVEIKAIDGTTITYLDGTTGTVPASGRANYVIVDYSKGHGTENATCYHFKDGKVWNHEDGGKEIVNGVEVLKEDKQHIYLEFNNLVTGYGWGVTSKGVGDLAGVTILDREVGTSVEKFEGKVTELVNNKTFKLGDIFTFVDNGVELVPGALTVTVTNCDENNPVSATIVYDRENWENGTITFAGTGTVKITIQDYYFCTPTTIEVTVTDRQHEEKFDVVMNNGDFLHRVGNSGTVALDKLFKAKDGVEIGTVSVTVEAVNGTSASGTYFNNAIQFNGTGVVKVTIKDDDKYCSPTVLYLEVVDAYNATSAQSTVVKDGNGKITFANNVVLLNNISSGFTVADGYAFYGNGFKVTCSGKGTYLNNGGMTLGYVNVQTGGILDNVQVICDIYPNAFVYSEEVKVSSNLDQNLSETGKNRYMYQLSAIAVSGDGSVVSNCYVYGGRNNIFVGGGNVTIENTVTECGTLANIQIAGIKDTAVNTVTLKDITTIQYKNPSTYDSTKIMLGFGIVVGDNESTANPYIILQGDLKQYNWVTSDDTSVSNTYAKAAIEGALAVATYHHTINGKTAVNMGIAYMNGKTTLFLAEHDQRTNKQQVPYTITSVKISGQTGYVYSISGSAIDGTSRYNAADDGVTPYKPNAQRDVVPKPVFSLGNQTVNGEDRYLIGDINGITARYESGQDAFTLDITKLMTATKYGSDCMVNVICTDPNGNTLNGIITLNKSGNYTLKFTVVDTAFYYLDGEEVVKVDKTIEYTYTVSIKLTIAEPSVPDATLTVKTGSYTGEYTDSTADGSKKLSIKPLTPLTITDAGSQFTPTSNVKSVDISYSATGTDGNGNAFGGATTITITYTEGQVLKIVLAKPTSNSPGNPKSITYDYGTGTVKSSNALARKSCTDASWAVSSYSFTGKNGKTVTANGVTFSIEANTSGGGCVTPDTLVTLANGTQKRIDQVTNDDMLLVWNFYTGEYTAVPASIIMNHGYANVTVTTLNFADGTSIKTIGGHGFFDAATNKFVLIDESNVAEYIGHAFIKQDGDGYTTTELVSYSIDEQETEVWSILTSEYYNCVLEGMWTVTAAEVENSPEWLMPYEIAQDMKYDEAKMQADIEQYGLYTYEDFAEYCTYDQFVAFGLANFKVSVGKGYITFDEILYLLSIHVG